MGLRKIIFKQLEYVEVILELLRFFSLQVRGFQYGIDVYECMFKKGKRNLEKLRLRYILEIDGEYVVIS